MPAHPYVRTTVPVDLQQYQIQYSSSRRETKANTQQTQRTAVSSRHTFGIATALLLYGTWNDGGVQSTTFVLLLSVPWLRQSNIYRTPARLLRKITRNNTEGRKSKSSIHAYKTTRVGGPVRLFHAQLIRSRLVCNRSEPFRLKYRHGQPATRTCRTFVKETTGGVVSPASTMMLLLLVVVQNCCCTSEPRRLLVLQGGPTWN